MIEQVQTVLDNPRRIKELPRYLRIHIWTYGLTAAAKHYQRGDEANALDVMDSDWDSLVLLDGCRTDLYMEKTGREPETVNSAGSASWEFMNANFVGRELHDTVYISANPHIQAISDDTFHAVRDLTVTDWNPDDNTVSPEAVTEAAKEAVDEYPNKRLIIHYMQPHFPFIGPQGRHLDIPLSSAVENPDETKSLVNPWYRLVQEGHTVSEIVTAYRENFEMVWPHVESLIDELEGKTVVSADHGNLIGERLAPIPIRGLGHPPEIHHPNLVEVPWDVYQTGERREIVSEPPVESGDVSDNVVEDRLKHLGYR